MKHQQISVDFVSMVFSAYSYLALAAAVWIFLRIIQACFWLPHHLKKQNDVQRMLQDKVENYEKYILECEEKEKSEQEVGDKDGTIDPALSEKWKERRECLSMLKRELSRVHDSSDKPPDWDYLLEEDETIEEDASITEMQDNEISKDKCNENTYGDENASKKTVDLEYKKEK